MTPPRATSVGPRSSAPTSAAPPSPRWCRAAGSTPSCTWPWWRPRREPAARRRGSWRKRSTSSAPCSCWRRASGRRRSASWWCRARCRSTARRPRPGGLHRGGLGAGPAADGLRPRRDRDRVVRPRVRPPPARRRRDDPAPGHPAGCRRGQPARALPLPARRAAGARFRRPAAAAAPRRRRTRPRARRPRGPAGHVQRRRARRRHPLPGPPPHGPPDRGRAARERAAGRVPVPVLARGRLLGRPDRRPDLRSGHGHLAVHRGRVRPARSTADALAEFVGHRAARAALRRAGRGRRAVPSRPRRRAGGPTCRRRARCPTGRRTCLDGELVLVEEPRRPPPTPEESLAAPACSARRCATRGPPVAGSSAPWWTTPSARCAPSPSRSGWTPTPRRRS